MKKERFLQVAPQYYALAISTYLFDNETATKSGIIASFKQRDDFDGRVIYRLKNGALFEEALKLLESVGIIEQLKDDFGPTIIIRPDNFYAIWNDGRVDEVIEPFKKYKRLGERENGWLISALDKLNAVYDELGVTDADFDHPDVEWEPLPIDREDEKVGAAIESVEDVIEQVERNNGYAATVPEERALVLDALKNTVSRLKRDAHISVAYLRQNAFDPLFLLTSRFAKSAIGVAASGAAAALLKFIGDAGTSAMTSALKKMFGL